MMSLERLLFNY